MAFSTVESGFVSVQGERVAFSVVRSKRRRRTIAFKMEPDARLTVWAPASASLGAVTRILEKRANWIARELDERKKAPPQEAFIDGASFLYLGHACKLRVTRGPEAPTGCILSPHLLRVHVPDAALSGEALRQEVRFEIALWLKKRARVLLKRRMDWWAARMGVRYTKLIVSAPDRRWGSCSADDVIRLNWRLLMAPLPILDYVVVHELAHIRHKDHSTRFWACVEKAIPDCKARRQHLRRLEYALTIGEKG